MEPQDQGILDMGNTAFSSVLTDDNFHFDLFHKK